ncbi:hypothetical protein ACU610_07620 [Geodermatophilus sp. URMC 61]|uniref:hypothetical protein n=1 Tax=Geodermatophilus sp. URMC 61 TaxID=3423411 RepID=UPI00406CEBF6
MAICGAATVHIFSLLVLVGILGTWPVSVVPEDIRGVTRIHVSPATTVTAVVVAVLVQLNLVPDVAARPPTQRPSCC